ncbi:amidohydrolase family protein [Halostreptopolyspora alba]|uniref:Amidohydrolase family protein n=2 Tax=Halostreptopolyspora alba TaxID=2487137 RepID=A0A3N0EGX2_9ACTN|nr:amidohydrolase family protein [Nocardiopsaceae bacterium YIM 96095]
MTDGASSATSTSHTTVIRGVRVFDGTKPLDANSVLIRDGVVAEVGTDLSAHHATETVEGAGGTLLPGLIDSHTHTLRVAELEQALAFGVTTELDMFCVPELLEPLRGAAASRDDVADIRSAGIGASVPGGHPTQLVEMGVYPPFPTLASDDEAPGFVADRVSEGSDYLKILIEDGSTMGWGGQPRLDARTVSALSASAHARGLRVLAHISTQADAYQAVATGVHGLAHLFVDQPPEPEFVHKAAESGIFAVPTITIFELLHGTARRETAYVDHPRLWPYLDPVVREALLSDWREHLPWQPPHWASAEHTRRAARLLHQAGVPVLAGTDVAHPRAAHGLSLHAELAALVDAGLSPTEALTAATRAPADAFGLTDRGRITPGSRADLLLVAGDPTSDITATGEITGIWRRGQRFDRDAYQAGLNTP